MKNRLEPKTPEKTEPPRTEADDRSAAPSQAQSDCREQRDPSENFMAVIWIFGAGFGWVRMPVDTESVPEYT
jgi:hypothetical protein